MGNFLVLPPVLVAIGALLGIIFTGIFFFVGLFDKEKKSATKAAEEANQYVIKSLQQKLDLLEEKVQDQQKAIDTMTKEIAGLKKENSNLQDLVIVALESYFDHNPTIAQDISQKVK